MIVIIVVVLCFVTKRHHRSKNLSENNSEINVDIPNQVAGPNEPMYADITDEESKDPTYASVGVATGKYTYNITTNTSYDTVMLHNMNPNVCYGTAGLHDSTYKGQKLSMAIFRLN